MKIPRLTAIAVLALLLFAVPVSAEEAKPLDAGKFTIVLAGEPLGTEEFQLDQLGDSLVLQAYSQQQLPSPAEPDGKLRIDKQLGLILNVGDYGLRRHISKEVMRGDTLARGVEPTEGDTTVTVWRDERGDGVGTWMAMPPGRLYVLDSPPLFSAFDMICRSLHGKVFESRPLNVLVLSARDSIVEAKVTDLGSETLRWGGKPVVTRKLSLTSGDATFTMWVSPIGRMLKLRHAESGLIVEREAPPVRKSSKRSG